MHKLTRRFLLSPLYDPQVYTPVYFELHTRQRLTCYVCPPTTRPTPYYPHTNINNHPTMLGSSFRLFQQLSLCAILCTFLSTQAYATPLSLSQRSILEDVSVALASLKSSGRLDKRDVVAPPIIKPDANSVWPIGTVQEVTWCVVLVQSFSSQL